MSGPDALNAFLREQAGLSTIFGENDCGLMVADWVRMATGIDPCPELRGAYGNEPEAQALMGEGGVPLRAAKALRRAGIRVAKLPDRGDVVLFTAGNGKGLGIWTGTAAAARLSSGLIIINWPFVIKAWRVPWA